MAYVKKIKERQTAVCESGVYNKQGPIITRQNGHEAGRTIQCNA